MRKPGLESRLRPRPQFRAPRYRAAGKLTGKVALITGGDSGIGRSVAVLFAREGADVAIVYLPSEESDARRTLQEIEAEGRRALLVPGDVTRPRFCERAVARTLLVLGHLDILVNNAAYQTSRETPEAIDLAQWDKTFKTNIYGYFFMIKAALPHLAAGASIINCSSVAGIRGSEKLIDYAATKGAINAFTKSLASNLVDRGIRVNAVAPGPVCMRRPAQPEEIAPAFVYFASEADSSYVTGEILAVQGGEIV